MPEPRFIDVFVDENPGCPEGCGLRFKSESAARPISRVELEGRGCAVTGWSSAGGGTPCEAFAATVDDSGSGTALLIFGGDWGLRFTPTDGSPAFGEPYLLLAPNASNT